MRLLFASSLMVFLAAPLNPFRRPLCELEGGQPFLRFFPAQSTTCTTVRTPMRSSLLLTLMIPLRINKSMTFQTAQTTNAAYASYAPSLCRPAVQTLSKLKEVPTRSRLKTAIGLAIPAIEAWYRYQLDPHAIEADLIRRPDAGTRALRNQLKQDVYGTNQPGSEMSIARAMEEATRLVQILDDFERLFPNGFGALARDIRSW